MPDDLTLVLAAIEDGDTGAVSQLLPLVVICGALAAYVSPWTAIVIGVPAIALAMVFFSALRGVYVAALYRYATTGESRRRLRAGRARGAFRHKAR